MNDNRLLVDWKALKAMGHPYSRQHTMRLVADGAFPNPVRFGSYRTGRNKGQTTRLAWLMKDYLTWLENYQAASQDVS